MTVIDWLLDSDPSIRWQVMRDLTGAPAEEVATVGVVIADMVIVALAVHATQRRPPTCPPSATCSNPDRKS